MSTELRQPTATSTGMRRAGWIITALPVLFLLFDATIKLLQIQPVVEAFQRLGIPGHLAPAIGTLQLACIVLHLYPPTALLGAVLLTGFLGGATMIHVRVGDPLVSHTLFPAYVGALAWAGLYLRDARLRALAFAPRPRVERAAAVPARRPSVVVHG
jgi:hypothetical protein